MNSRKTIHRREFLRLASLLPAAWFTQPLLSSIKHTLQGANVPNVIVLVFDAWSADHIQLHGYPRTTMPNLEKFAARATVFHNHYSAGTFTVPGTASLLTGLHPWTHRALNLGSGGITSSQQEHNIFHLLSNTHSTLGFAQNEYADLHLFQMAKDLDVHLPVGAFDLEHYTVYNQFPFGNDAAAAFASFEDNIIKVGPGRDASLFLGPLFRILKIRESQSNERRFADKYPRGLPKSTEQFLLSNMVDGAIQTLRTLKQPSLAYMHFNPPHAPYSPTLAFENAFNDGWVPIEKPIHPFSLEKTSHKALGRRNRNYDQYLLSWDAEVGRLYEFLDVSGLLDNSYILITADHGELFERGTSGHTTPLIFEPLIHIPLIVSRPRQTAREDVWTRTSSVDILPTLANVNGNPIPDWAEGKLLPSLGGNEDEQRSIYALDAKTNSVFGPLHKLTMSLTRGTFRLTYYNYPPASKFEFYDLAEDGEEMNDLYPSQPALAVQMKDELLQKLSEVNKPFER